MWTRFPFRDNNVFWWRNLVPLAYNKFYVIIIVFVSIELAHKSQLCILYCDLSGSTEKRWPFDLIFTLYFIVLFYVCKLLLTFLFYLDNELSLVFEWWSYQFGCDWVEYGGSKRVLSQFRCIFSCCWSLLFWVSTPIFWTAGILYNF